MNALPARRLLLVVCVAGLSSTSALSAEHQVQVAAGNHDRSQTPVEFTVPEELASAERLWLVTANDREALEVQWIDRKARRAAFVLEPPLKAGDSRTYRLNPVSGPAGDAAAVSRETEGAIELSIRGKPVLRYNTAVVMPPAGANPVFQRSGHIHPVWTRDGRIVTSEFPADHLHQHGIFSAWVNTTFEGRKVDFWNQAGKTGQIEHAAVVGTKSGEVFCEFTVELRHSDITAPGGPKPVLKEVWIVRAWDVAGGNLFDVESRQTCVADSPLVLNEYHYGGMAFRGTDQWFPGEKVKLADAKLDFDFITSEGKRRAEGNHTRPNWVLTQGKIDGAPAGIAVMGHPGNFRHPEPVRLHPSKPYFVFTPPVLGEYALESGVEHVTRYRYFVRDGAADVDAIERVWLDYSAPVTVEVQ